MAAYSCLIQDWKCPAWARAKARAMYTQGPIRAQGETIVIIVRARRVTFSLKNGQQQGDENINDDGNLDRPVAIESDGSHSWAVQLWGPGERSELA